MKPGHHQQNDLTRRSFMQSASLAAAGIGMKPVTGKGANAGDKPDRVDTPRDCCLWYVRGWTVQTMNNAWGISGWHWNPPGSAWYAQHLWAKAGTPELAEAARVSLDARGDKSTGCSRAWKINFRARLWDGDYAYKILRNLLTVVRETNVIYGEKGAGVCPNLLDSHPPFQIDGNLGAVAGYCEMLVQSHTGEIRLLPALPKAWPDGRVSGLRLRGGFEVDMTWKDSRLDKAVIHSRSDLPCKVVHGDKVWLLETKVGGSYPIPPA